MLKSVYVTKVLFQTMLFQFGEALICLGLPSR